MNEILVDTNLLVYSVDPASEAKRDRALEVLAALGAAAQGRLGVQSLAEFARVVTRPQRPLLTLAETDARIAAYLRSWRVYDLTPAVVRAALAGVRLHRMNFWDAQIWAIARLHRLPTVFSEDFQDGASVDGVRFVNPFTSTFDFTHWR